MKWQQRTSRLNRLATSLCLVAWASAAWASAACAGQTVAIFPFELLDTSQEDNYVLKISPDETKRLTLLTQDLTARLSQLEGYQVVDTSNLTADIKAAAPLHKCNGCEVGLVQKTGAQLAVLGLVQKFSDTLLAVSIQVLDAQTGALRNSYSAGIQGNTDEAWLRGVSYIVRNQMTPPPTPQGTSQ
jgi:hypothetical protein